MSILFLTRCQYISITLSLSWVSPNVKYINERPATEAAISCINTFSLGSPLKAPQPQLPVAIAGKSFDAISVLKPT